MYGNAQVLDEELNLLLLGFFGMVFHMVLSFHINLINRKCCNQHTYAIFLLKFLTLESLNVQWIDCEKNYYIFFYELLILMKGLTSVGLSATIISNILKTIYLK